MNAGFDEVFQEIKSIVKDVLMDVEENEIVPTAVIKDDLGGDSLDLVDIAVRIERHFGIPFNLESLLNQFPDYSSGLTVQALVELAVFQVQAVRSAVSAQ
jgi:acyl carrier protein